MTPPTAKVLRGIIAATSNVLAGPEDGECERDWKAIEEAQAWAVKADKELRKERARHLRAQRDAAKSMRADMTKEEP